MQVLPDTLSLETGTAAIESSKLSLSDHSKILTESAKDSSI